MVTMSHSISSTRVAVVNKVNVVPSQPEETNNLEINKTIKYCKVLENQRRVVKSDYWCCLAGSGAL